MLVHRVGYDKERARQGRGKPGGVGPYYFSFRMAREKNHPTERKELHPHPNLPPGRGKGMFDKILTPA